MYNTKEFVNKMVKNGFYPFLCVPCSALKGIINCIIEYYPEYYYPVNNEGEAVAMSVGLFLNGNKPVVMLQNSGIGNMLDPITSLMDVYEIPLVFITSWRGKPGIKDEKQHLKMGKITEELFSLCDIEYIDLTLTKDNNVTDIMNEINTKYTRNKSVSLLVNQDTFFYDNPQNEVKNGMTTHLAMEMVLEKLTGKEKIVSSTGYITRELYNLCHTKNNFYMVGSMGCAISIGVGLAISSQERVVVLDGDGSALMRLEGMVPIAHYKCNNLLHIIFENGMYESTGGQPTLANGIEIDTIARGCGYKRVCVCEDIKKLENELEKSIKYDEGSQLILIKVKKNEKIMGRRKLNYTEIKEAFLKK